MTRPADFNKPVRESLAKRAGFRCSFPGCGVSTVGPSGEGPESTSNTGMACHIIAASEGPSARRVIPNMSANELSNISNGIWMCYRHGKLIDTDEATYTVDMLRTWRRVAELRAKLSHELGRDVEFEDAAFAEIPLPEATFHLNGLGDENRVLGEAIRLSCVTEIWGTDFGHVIRDFAVEVARNALTHGEATRFCLEIERNRIRFIDDGQPFDPTCLSRLEQRSGGIIAASNISNYLPVGAILSHHRNEGLNITIVSLASSPEHVSDATPCAVKIDQERLRISPAYIRRLDYCSRIYLILPRYLALSDVLRLCEMLSSTIDHADRIVFVTSQVSERVVRLLRDELPGAHVMKL